MGLFGRFSIALVFLTGCESPEQLPQAAPRSPIERIDLSPPFLQTERECLGRTIYFEARGSSLAVQLGVGLVVLNRVRISGRSICATISMGERTRSGGLIRNRCHFSWYCDGKTDKPSDLVAWKNILTIVDLLSYTKVVDFTGGATHFHSGKPVWWSQDYIQTVKIDDVTFYKDRR